MSDMRRVIFRTDCSCAVAVLYGMAAGIGSPVSAQECSFALRPSEATLEPLRTAIGMVNGVVDDPALTLEIAGESQLEETSVPVFVVRPNEANEMVAHVREGCRAILIGSHEFETAFSRLAEGHGLIESREAEMLALLLLHELGHIHHGHYGQFVPSEKEPSLNLDPTGSKVREEMADRFAAQILRDQLEAMGRGEAHLPAMMLVPFVANLSFIISSQASLDCFGCRVLGSPDIFWDHSQSHENLEYRLLKMNHAIGPSESSQQLLEDYERQRADSGRGVLYYRP